MLVPFCPEQSQLNRVEPVFGEIKWDGGKPSMDLRSSVKVRDEFSLMRLVHNVKKIVKRVSQA